jgi:hypothetical protein
VRIKKHCGRPIELFAVPDKFGDIMNEDIELSNEKDYWEGQEIVRNLEKDQLVDEYLEDQEIDHLVTQEWSID